MADKDVGYCDVIDDKIVITTFTGANPQNIFHLVRSFRISESVYNNCMIADFYVSEGIELLNYLPAGGEERITLSVQTPTRKKIKYNFFVHSIRRISTDSQSLAKQYILSCVSEDYLKNAHTLITKRYKGKEYRDAVAECIQNDLGSSKPVEIETTKGFFDYVVNDVRPFQIMDLLTERAVSKKYKGHNYVFYEDNEMYRFVTLEHLIETRKRRAEGFKYVFDTSNRAEDYADAVNIRNILSYRVRDQGDSVEKVKLGAHRVQVREFDLIHGDYFKKEEYINSSDHGNFKKLDNSPDLHSTAYNAQVETMPAVSLITIKDSTRPEMKHNETIAYKRAHKLKSNAYTLDIDVYGDTTLLVGDVIDLMLPEISGVTVNPPEQQIYSGNYLVLTVNNTYEKEGETGRYNHFQTLELIKTNLKKSLG
jgi:hypothetical protein